MGKQWMKEKNYEKSVKCFEKNGELMMKFLLLNSDNIHSVVKSLDFFCVSPHQQNFLELKVFCAASFFIFNAISECIENTSFIKIRNQHNKLSFQTATVYRWYFIFIIYFFYN